MDGYFRPGLRQKFDGETDQDPKKSTLTSNGRRKMDSIFSGNTSECFHWDKLQSGANYT